MGEEVLDWLFVCWLFELDYVEVVVGWLCL